MRTSITALLPRLGLLGALSLSGGAIQAQTAPPTWASVQRSTSTVAGSSALATKVAVAADGSQFVSGEFSGTATLGGTTVTAPAGSTGLFLAKFNPDGTLAWLRQGTEAATQEVTAMISVDAAGNSFLAGYFTESLVIGTASLTVANHATDVYVVKFDPQGNVLWAKTGGVTNGSAYCLNSATDAAGNVYLTGDFTGSLGFGGPAVNPAGNDSDVFLCKLTPAGTAVWTRRAGSANSDLGYGLATDAAGNAYITGSVRTSATFGTITLPSPAGGDDLFVAKYDPQGNALWARRAGGAADDRGTAVAVDAAGNVAVTGFADNAEDVNGDYVSSIYVAQYSAQGALAWEHTISPSATSEYSGYAVAFDNRGGLYLTGYYEGTVTFGTITLPAASAFGAMYTVRYDAQGRAIWADRTGASGSTVGGAVGASITTDGSGNAYVAGAALGTVNFGSIISSGSGSGLFLAKLNAGGIITAARSAVADVKLRVYPNPAADRATLELPVGGGHLVLTDALGRTVREQTLPASAGACPVALTGLVPGLYQLRATLGNGQTASTRLTVR